jgi:nitrate reductase delta subunit
MSGSGDGAVPRGPAGMATGSVAAANSVIPAAATDLPTDIPVVASDPTLKLVSILMQYPTTALFDGLPLLIDTAAQTPRKAREHLGTFLQWLGYTAPDEVARHYVNTFDLRKRCALYLTYYRYGDTRNRGMALIEFKTAYRTAGFTPDEYELPDYLPMVLDFAALCERGQRLLHGHRADLELLRRALEDAGSPYAELLAAVLASLPGLGRRELKQVLTAWQSGPPTEEVGLEPFAPPEYMNGYGRPATSSLQETSR